MLTSSDPLDENKDISKVLGCETASPEENKSTLDDTLSINLDLSCISTFFEDGDVTHIDAFPDDALPHGFISASLVLLPSRHMFGMSQENLAYSLSTCASDLGLLVHPSDKELHSLCIVASSSEAKGMLQLRPASTKQVALCVGAVQLNFKSVLSDEFKSNWLVLHF